MFAIEVQLLTGRYFATAYNDRRSVEWPPHPARLYSALVATHHGDPLDDEPSVFAERAALEWLEGLEAPSIACSEAFERDSVTVFVPINDAGVTKNLDDEYEELMGLADAVSALRLEVDGLEPKDRKAKEKELAKKEKDTEKAIERFKARIASEIAAPTKIGKSAPEHAASVLPEGRNRQPRTFPSCTPASPRFVFVWSDIEADAATKVALDGLLARIVRLGHSASLVTARVLVPGDETPEPAWIPGDGSLRLRVPRAGQLEALEGLFARHRETEPRVMPARHVSYRRPTRRSAHATSITCFEDEWLVFRRVEGPRLPSVAAVGVARTFRRALLSQFGALVVPSLLTGHGGDGAPIAGDHLALVPLPFVGHEHADGAILGLAAVFPRNTDDASRRAIYRAIASWEEAARSDPMNADGDPDAAPLLPLHLGEAGVVFLERLDGPPRLRALSAETWCGVSTSWSSVTPVALDRNPGDLRANKPAKLEKALNEARNTIESACARIGLPRPMAIEILPAAPWAGAAKARQFGVFRHGDHARVLTHVRIQFDVPVRGPILLGAGRYFGLGLFRPEADHG